VKVGVNLLWLVPGRVGGSEEYAVRLLDHVATSGAAAGIDVTVFASRATLDAHGSLRERFRAVVAPERGGKAGRALVESSWLAAESRRHRLDLVHHLGGTIPPLRGAPAVVTIHDLQPLHRPEAFGAVKRRWLGVMVPLAVRRARLVVAVSRFTADDLIDRLGVPPARIRVVRHGIDLPAEPVPAAELARVRERYRLGRRWITYPAATWRHKNHLTLVRAFGPLAAADDDLTLVLTGRAAEGEDDLRHEIERLGLGERVRRTERIPRADVDALIAGAAAVALPSTFEGFGAPAAEAMALGAPLVAADATALPEVTGDAALLLDPLDVGAWTKALRTLLDEPDTAARLVARGRERAAALGWDEPVRALVETWHDAVRVAA
jgi:alpha-1,3-rhamnosyl/mannosyltransferase